MTTGELSGKGGPDPLVGVDVGPYRVVRRLGAGGMATVYEAIHRAIERRVALKVLSPQIAGDAVMVERFLLEARSACRIAHENVIEVFDLAQSREGYVYLAMELLPGGDLAATLKGMGALPWSRARTIALQIGEALHAAHAKGIVHRDLKPENVFLVDRRGRPVLVKLLDFGIAKVMSEGGPRLTRTGAIFGTPEYMAPEQIEARAVDQRTDIYAFGCVLYHLMTGSVPFPSQSVMDLLRMQLSQKPEPPSARRPDLDLPPALDATILRALEKAPDQRWQDVREMTAALAEVPARTPARATNASTDEMEVVIDDDILETRSVLRASSARVSAAVRSWAGERRRWRALAVAAAALGAVLWLYRARTAVGTLQVTVRPEDARLSIDGIPVAGRSPFVVERRPGTYQVAVERAGYDRQVSSVAPREGSTQTIVLELKPSIATGFEIVSEPVGGLVWLDGFPFGEASGPQARTNFRALRVPPVRHLVEIRQMPGYDDWRQAFVQQPDTIVRLRAVMKPKAETPTTPSVRRAKVR
jgi:serine/threonine protein kinase